MTAKSRAKVSARSARCSGVSGEKVAVSVPVPSQRFYRREAELAKALLSWVAKVEAWFAKAGD